MQGFSFDGVTCLGGHDAVHFNGCDDVLIQNCTFKTGDDCFSGFDNHRVTVRGCGLSVYQIAKQSGLTWRTVKKVTDGIPVRFDTAERIRFVMQQNASTAIGN